MKKFNVIIHTDGACRGNPGKGGYAALLECNGKSKTIYGGAENTTNNRMELMAVVEGLRALNAPCQVTICSDSKFVVQGISQWMHAWANQDWRKANGKCPAHLDLWRQVHQSNHIHSLSAVWVKGHAGNYANEIVNTLAGKAIPS